MLGSGLDEDKTGGGVGSPGACTCGRGVPACAAIRVSISQPPKPSPPSTYCC